MPTMNPWFAKALILLASIVMVVIRAPHGQRSRTIPVVRSRRGPREAVLLAIAGLAFFLPLIWTCGPWCGLGLCSWFFVVCFADG